MELVKIMTGPYDDQKIGERMAALRKACVVGRQIASYYVRPRADHSTGDARANGAKIVTPGQVAGQIHAGGVLVEKRIAGVIVFRGGVAGVAGVAIGLRIDDIAADSNL